MKKFASLLALLAVACLMMVTAPQQADARPQYNKAFGQKYEKVAGEAKKLKCGVCHGEKGKKKKLLSDYGKALKEAVGKKNQKDADVIDEAYDTIAEQKPEGGDKTYGEMLEAGELPAPHKAE
ncbi:MAG: hypothetical protein ACC652_15760 [Acidimicrobiales bacterium]